MATRKVRFSDLPLKVVYQALSYLSPERDGFNIVCTSTTFYNLYIMDLYKEAGEKSSWAPLFVGAVSGNIRTIKRCLDAGASLDYRWPGNDPKWWVLYLDEGVQPIHAAMMHYRVETVEWILD